MPAPNTIFVPSKTDFQVYAWDKPTSWSLIATFKDALHAETFAKSVKCFTTIIVPPSMPWVK